jgi:muramoyltetrapeptide carboxypeptidase
MDMIKPEPLQPGDTIALVSPSAGLAGLIPHRLDRAIEFLKASGYFVRQFPSTRSICRWESATPQQRAMDLMSAFTDKEIKAIICTIGGNTANKTLDLLDYETIRSHPKIFCGYSDISVLHYAIYKQCRLSTFYGPAAMTQFGEYPKPLEYTISHFKKAVVLRSIGRILPSPEWTDETLDWEQKADLERPRLMKPNKGYDWLRSGVAEGPILGGCITSIMNLIGTYYWPSHEGVILFLELPEGNDFGKPTPLPQVDELLCALRLAGIFDEITGLIFGRPFKYGEGEEAILKEIILENTNGYDFPILFGADIGHTDPQITIPLGAMSKLNSITNGFSIAL